MPSQRPPFPAGQMTRVTTKIKVAQRAMRRKVAAARGRHDRPHARPLSSFRCETRHRRSMHDREQRLAASRSENSSTQGLQQHPESTPRAHTVRVMCA